MKNTNDIVWKYSCREWLLFFVQGWIVLCVIFCFKNLQYVDHSSNRPQVIYPDFHSISPTIGHFHVVLCVFKWSQAACKSGVPSSAQTSNNGQSLHKSPSVLGRLVSNTDISNTVRLKCSGRHFFHDMDQLEYFPSALFSFT